VNQYKLADIILSGFFTMIFVGMVYFLLERIGLVPIISLYSPNPSLLTKNTITNIESVIILIIAYEISWIVAIFLYWKVIRKYKVVF